jgi:hypothetical protein
MRRLRRWHAGWWGALVPVAMACSSAGPAETAASGDAGARPSVDAGAREGSASSEAGAATSSDGSAGDAGADVGAASPEAGATSCSDLPLCDGFESDAPGAAPAGWTVSMGCNPNTTDTASDGGLLVGVDASEHHSGAHSLRVVGGDSCGYYVVQTGAFATLGPQLYARFWVMFSGGPTPNHNGFLSMATSGGDHLRLGFQDDVVAWNAQTSDATLPDMDPQGTSGSVAPAAGTWSCMEFHVDETDGHIELWLDGAAVTGLGYDGTSTQGVDDQWARGGPSPAVPVNLGLGWLGLNDQQTVWFDDVALGNARVGCQ